MPGPSDPPRRAAEMLQASSTDTTAKVAAAEQYLDRGWRVILLGEGTGYLAALLRFALACTPFLLVPLARSAFRSGPGILRLAGLALSGAGDRGG